MWRDLGLTAEDWERTPDGVRTVLLSLHHQLRLFQIRHTAYEQQISALRKEVAQLDDLKAEINELRERLNQNSANSSRPPSSDPPYKKRPRPDGKKSKKKKRGGQPGHQGIGRLLKPLVEVDHIVDLHPLKCRQCGRKLTGEDPDPARRQVSEIPPAIAEVTEYRRHTLCCSSCGVATPADWPEDIPAGSFGPRAKAIVAYLAGRVGASHRDVTEAMEVLHGLKVGLGTVSRIERQVSKALAEPVERARRFVRQQRAQYVDETGWKESGKQKWLWINATRDVTDFHLLGNRNADAAKTVIDAKAKATITSDRCGAYNWLPGRRRQICWAHLMRDFQAFVERGGDSKTTGDSLLKQAGKSFKLWHKMSDGLLTRNELKARMEPIKETVSHRSFCAITKSFSPPA